VELGLQGKRAIVTGASKGLGRAIADELAAEGADVAMCSRDDTEIKGAAEAIRSATGRRVHAEVCDVTDAGQVGRFVASAATEFGGVDILVNNAGRARPGDFEALSDEDWKADLDVKLFSMIRFTREVLPHFRAAGGGRVVNVNAVYGRYPDPAFFATSVNRAACLSLTKALAMELAPDGVLVNSVNIGFVRTPQWEGIHARRAPDVSQEEFFRRLAEAEVPLGRFGEPEEVSGVVAFLVSSRAGYVTGASVDVAGGMGKYV